MLCKRNALICIMIQIIYKPGRRLISFIILWSENPAGKFTSGVTGYNSKLIQY